MIEILEKRVGQILAVGRESDLFDSRTQRIEGYLKDSEIGEAHCFHLMELIRIVKGEKTSGVYDDFGEPPTITGPLFTSGSEPTTAQSSKKGRRANS